MLDIEHCKSLPFLDHSEKIAAETHDFVPMEKNGKFRTVVFYFGTQNINEPGNKTSYQIIVYHPTFDTISRQRKKL